MLANPSKFRFLFLSKYENLENTIKSSDAVELLGISLNRNVNFKQHIENICCKANTKTKALFHSKKFLNLKQSQILGVYSIQF